jgi:hypothetical protein
MTRSQGGEGSVRLDPGMEDPDRFYEELLAAHQGLSLEQSFELNARLLMLLANQVGSRAVISECIRLARESGGAVGA